MQIGKRSLTDNNIIWKHNIYKSRLPTFATLLFHFIINVISHIKLESLRRIINIHNLTRRVLRGNPYEKKPQKRSSFGISSVWNFLVYAHSLQTSHQITFTLYPRIACGSTLHSLHNSYSLFALQVTTNFFRSRSQLSLSYFLHEHLNPNTLTFL